MELISNFAEHKNKMNMKSIAIITPAKGKVLKEDIKKMTFRGLSLDFIHNEEVVVASDVTESSLIKSLCQNEFGLNKAYNVTLCDNIGSLKLSQLKSYSLKKGFDLCIM